MVDMSIPEPTAIVPYRLGDFAKGGSIDFLTQGNVSIPLSLDLLKAIVTVKPGDRAPNTTELVMFVNAVIEQGCNCYLNECWLVFIRGKYVPIIAAQKRIAKAQSISSYDGYEWGWIDKEGFRCPAGPDNKVKQDDIIGVWGRIYFKDRKVPFYHEVFRSEYSYPKSDRKITMLLKTARDQLHRYAFANEMGNLCTENEPYEEPLPAPESDVLPRDERRKTVPNTAVDTTRAPAKEAETGDEPAHIDTGGPSPAEEEKPESELVTFVCKSCGQTFRYGKEEGKGVKCECGKGVLVEAEPTPEPMPALVEDAIAESDELETLAEEVTAEPAADSVTEEKVELVTGLYMEVNGMYVAQNGKDFIEFASYVLCLDDSEVSPSKLNEDQLKQIKAYIETNGVAIS